MIVRNFFSATMTFPVDERAVVEVAVTYTAPVVDFGPVCGTPALPIAGVLKVHFSGERGCVARWTKPT